MQVQINVDLDTNDGKTAFTAQGRTSRPRDNTNISFLAVSEWLSVLKLDIQRQVEFQVPNAEVVFKLSPSAQAHAGISLK
jgi:hypothetical protein